MSKNFTVYTDCINFPLDRPCIYQKNDNMHCDSCSHYISSKDRKENTRILIIKLGAMGDVLRTTFLLEGLKELYPQSNISWIVHKKNSEVLKGNKLIDNIIFNDDNINDYLIKNYFDTVINLDLAPESLALAKLSNKARLIGYTTDDKRNIIASNKAAEEWLKMSAYDELKKANNKTYQHHMAKITEIPKDNYEIIVPLNSSSVEKANDLLSSFNIINKSKKIIGINPGAGKRWKLKKWRTDGFIETAKYFSQKGHTILLLGGFEDKEDIDAILKENIPNVFSTGTENPIPDFFAMINLCDIVLCGDTMALHAAAGLKKNIVALFGPTSLPEIEVYERGIKLQSNKECISCYKQECNIIDNCMAAITDEEVIKAIEKFL